jgi:predicted dienelactone hydrolase
MPPRIENGARSGRRPWVWIAMIALAGCAPPALYKPGPGPLAIAVTEAVARDDPRQRDIRMRIVTPDGKGPFPAVVFSHGAFCYSQNYARVTDHWASHGYVVISPDHLDSPNNRERMRADQAAMLLDSRVRDLTVIVDQLAVIAPQADVGRIAIAGHSFGGMLAMIKAGLLLRDPRGGAPVSHADPRFRATVVLSGVGPMPQMADNAFGGLDGALFASGGTRDEGNVGTGEIFPWQWRMSPYTLAPPGDKYSLVIDNADHYLGGLICRDDRGGEDDFDAVRIVASLSLAFLDAYVEGEPAARRFLQRADVRALTAGRARFERK